MVTSKDTKRSKAARKAAQTRKDNARKRRLTTIAKKAWVTRRRNDALREKGLL